MRVQNIKLLALISLILGTTLVSALLYENLSANKEIKKFHQYDLPVMELNGIVIRISKEIQGLVHLSLLTNTIQSIDEYENLAFTLNSSVEEMRDYGLLNTKIDSFKVYLNSLRTIEKQIFASITSGDFASANKLYHEAYSSQLNDFNKMFSAMTIELINKIESSVENHEKFSKIFYYIFTIFSILWIVITTYLIKFYKKNRYMLVHSQLSERQQRVKAEKLARVKSDFLANMSHEIRTPMNGIIGVIELIKDSPLNEKQRKLLAMADECSDSLMGVINDILDFSKIEAGKLEIEELPFELRKIISDITSLHSMAIEKKGVSFSVTISEDISSIVVGDVLRIKQVLNNLLSNAQKFTSNGSIELAIKKYLVNGNQKIQFSVKDSGIGMSKDAVKGLFEPFSQADTTTTRKFGGTGLGLAITHRLVKLMGGDIFLESEENIGSTFKVVLPLEEIIEKDTVVSLVQPPTDSDKIFALNYPHKILVVEDNTINKEVVSNMLSSLGYNCDVASDGSEALLLVESNNYSIILMDLHMSSMDGITTSKYIFKKYGEAAPVIIPLTASVLDEQRKECAEIGMSDFLNKPLKLKEIKRVLSSYSIKNNNKNAS